VFVVIFVGVGLASITLLGEWLWKRYDVPNNKTTAVVQIKDRHLQSQAHAQSQCAHLNSYGAQFGGIGSPLNIPAFSSALSGMYKRPRHM
jgi:hypothetical protein